MTSKRLYLILLGSVGLLIVALLAGVYGANGLLTARANTLTSLKAKSQALTKEQQGLVQAEAAILQYGGLERTANKIVPQDKDQAEAVREIVNIADANGVSLGSITFPTSTLGASVSSANGVSTTPAPTQSSAASTKQAKLSQLLAVKGIPGVYQLTITVVSDVAHPVQYSQIINFLSGLEHDRRTAQVNSLVLQPVPDNRNYLTFTLTLNEYIKP